jgi:hypothetical protein
MTVEVDYNPEVTDPEGFSNGLDILLDTALSSEGILDDYDNPEVGNFIPRDRIRADVFVRSDLCKGCESYDESHGLKPPAACHECWTMRPSNYKPR